MSKIACVRGRHFPGACRCAARWSGMSKALTLLDKASERET
jgi:hypothetical protein